MCKGFNFVIPQKDTKYSDYLLPFKLLFRVANSLNFLSFDKKCVKSRSQDCVYLYFEQVSKISNKNLPGEEIKAFKNLTKKKDLVI